MTVEPTKPKTKPIPLRLDARMVGRISRAAKRMASNRAATMRFAIIQGLYQIESGTITLTPEDGS
jgi:hypothetical protein